MFYFWYELLFCESCVEESQSLNTITKVGDSHSELLSFYLKDFWFCTEQTVVGSFFKQGIELGALWDSSQPELFNGFQDTVAIDVDSVCI